MALYFRRVVLDDYMALGQDTDAVSQAENHMHIVLYHHEGNLMGLADGLEQVDGVVGIGAGHAVRRFLQ